MIPSNPGYTYSLWVVSPQGLVDHVQYPVGAATPLLVCEHMAL